MTYFRDVLRFHLATGLNVSEVPGLPDPTERALRRTLLQEEMQEYLAAETTDDIAEIAKELADVIYIALGTAVSYGIPMDYVFAEVQRSNMSKLVDGKPLRREDGKILKGPNYSPADVESVLYAYTVASEHAVWTALGMGVQLEALTNTVAEPYREWVVDCARWLWAEQELMIMSVCNTYQAVLQSIGATEDGEIDREAFIEAIQNQPHKDLLMRLLDNKPIASTVWNALEPSKPAKWVQEALF